MKDTKRVYNATRDRWVKIISKDVGVVHPFLTQMESFADEFERLVRGPEQRELAKHFARFVGETATLFGASHESIFPASGKPPVEVLEKMFADMARGLPPPKEPDKKPDQDRGR